MITGRSNIAGVPAKPAPWLKRYPGEMAAGADCLQCLHARDGGSAGQPLGELVLVGGVARDQFEQEVAAATDHVALPHLGPAGDQLLERGEHGLLLAVEP